MDNYQTPRSFYKDMHPEMFSDSVIVKNAIMDKSFFGYHLETLTNRSQEKEFEHFCRALAEKEICPNLIVQTGPTGGGDSKVDSETYPVADNLTLTWYSGIGREASAERWAFAFSAKKDWQSKVIADVESIISTNRNYAKIFFFSNQFISDKKRAATEDKLIQKHNVDIRILDRMWIVEKVFSNNHKEIAIEKLGLSDSFKDEVKIRPIDYRRRQKLDGLEQYIQSHIASDNPSMIIESAIDAAIVSRELELPNIETNVRFDRALILAKRYGTNKQEKECLYQWAWTLFWWHEDFQAYYQKYCLFEADIAEAPSINDLEHLSNLLLNLFRLSQDYKNDEHNLQEHLKKLQEYYNVVTENESKPNATLQARAIYIPIRLITGENIDDLVKELIDICKLSKDSLTLNFQLLKRAIMEIPVYQYASNYDELFELVVMLSENRKQELEAAQLLIMRARQLADEKPYSAIKYFGRASVKLIKEESKKDLTNTLFNMGALFESVELNWAAYGYYLNCFQIGMQHYFDYGEVYPNLLGALYGLKSFEMLNGRIIHAAEFHWFEQAYQNIYSTLYSDSSLKNILDQESYDIFDVILGIQIFRTNFEQLPFLEFVPAYLEENGLMFSSVALKYMLGHIDDNLLETLGSEAAVEEYIDNWYNQPARDQLINSPWYGLGPNYTFVSHVMGCTITFDAQNLFPCVEVAESIAAAIEAFMSTGIVDGMYSIIPAMTINVNLVPEKDFSIQSSITAGKHSLDVYCESYPEVADIDYQMKVKEFVLDVVIEVISRMINFENSQNALKNMMRNDNLLDRAITFTNSIQIIANCFNLHTPSVSYQVGKDTRCACIRTIPAVFNKQETNIVKDSVKPEVKINQYKVVSSLPNNLPSFEDVRQSEIITIPTINMPLWDDAKWRGAVVLSDGVKNLALSPIFENINAGMDIFKEWINLIGVQDKEDYVRVGLIKGIDKNNPTCYRVVFSANRELSIRSGNKVVMAPCRFHTMEAQNDNNVMIFEKMYRQIKSFVIFPSEVINGTVKLHPELTIHKTSIEICDAWEIDYSSFLSAAIFPFDCPVIPQNVIDAPVLNIIKRKITPFS